jgi:hypothetical protein
VLEMSVRESQAAEFRRVVRSIRHGAEIIGEALDELSGLLPSLPHEERITADNNSYSLFELAIGVHVIADSLEAAAGSLTAHAANDAGGSDEGAVDDD